MNIGIMCSSSDSLNIRSMYKNVSIASSLSLRDYDLVMGTSEHGLMGNVKELFRSKSHLITCVGLAGTDEYESSRADLKIPVESPGERVNKLYDESDMVIFLAGGVGTASEFYTMLTTKIELNDQKPLILYNGDDECNYDYILKDLEAKARAGAVNRSYRAFFDVVRNEDELFTLLDKYEKRIVKGKCR